VRLSAEEFIRQRMVLTPLSFRPDISLFRPKPESGLTAWLVEQGLGDVPPYWAYAWAGGAALALYLRDHPELVAGRSVLDFGSGGGLVAIAAAKAGAKVTAFEPDAIGRVATEINTEANGVAVSVRDVVTEAEIVLAGDVFYNAGIAAAVFETLSGLARGGTTVLIGDPFRQDLPAEQLTSLAEYAVPDFGSETLVRAGVFALGGR
jgi:predicted nicotinamide N-methyase